MNLLLKFKDDNKKLEAINDGFLFECDIEAIDYFVSHYDASLAKEIFKQRIEGMKDEHGVNTTQTFPKLLYVLDENNIHKDSEYYWLTELAMKSTALRQAPDYQSAKVMKELYGDVFPCINKACA